MRFKLEAQVSKYNFDEHIKKREDLDFDWDDLEAQFWDTSDDRDGLFDIYKTDNYSIVITLIQP